MISNKILVICISYIWININILSNLNILKQNLFAKIIKLSKTINGFENTLIIYVSINLTVNNASLIFTANKKELLSNI